MSSLVALPGIHPFPRKRKAVTLTAFDDGRDSCFADGGRFLQTDEDVVFFSRYINDVSSQSPPYFLTSSPPAPIRGDGRSKAVPAKYRTVFVDVAGEVEDFVDSIWENFSRFGVVENLRLEDGDSVAGITYLNFDDAQSCLNARPISLGGVDVNARRVPRPVAARSSNSAVYVSGVFHLPKAKLKEYFSKFGVVVNISVVRRKGFAFVRFEDFDSVEITTLQRFHLVDEIYLEVLPLRPSPSAILAAQHFVENFDLGPTSRLESGCQIRLEPFPFLSVAKAAPLAPPKA